MTAINILVVCAIVAAFLTFAVALAWGDFQSRQARRPAADPVQPAQTVQDHATDYKTAA